MIGGSYFYIFQSIFIQHSPGLLRKISQVTTIQSDTLEFMPTFPQLPGSNNGLGNSASKGIVSVNQQLGGVGTVFTRGAQSRQYIAETLNTGVTHRSSGMNMKTWR